MGKRFTGAGAYVDSVDVWVDKVRIRAVAGATRATAVVDLHKGIDVEEVVAAETEAAMVLAEMVDSGVEKGIAATVTRVDDDEDEGLREGPVVGSGPSTGFESRVDIEVVPSIAELKRRKAFAEAVIAECRAAEVSGSDDDWIRIPNAEYADLVAAARRDAAFRDALCRGFNSPGGSFERPVPDDGCESAGEIEIAEFVAATTGGETASDTSDAAQDDDSPVEPGLDIDALVAAADAQRDTCALDIREVRSGETFEVAITPGMVDCLRKALADARLAGGLR